MAPKKDGMDSEQQLASQLEKADLDKIDKQLTTETRERIAVKWGRGLDTDALAALVADRALQTATFKFARKALLFVALVTLAASGIGVVISGFQIKDVKDRAKEAAGEIENVETRIKTKENELRKQIANLIETVKAEANTLLKGSEKTEDAEAIEGLEQKVAALESQANALIEDEETGLRKKVLAQELTLDKLIPLLGTLKTKLTTAENTLKALDPKLKELNETVADTESEMFITVARLEDSPPIKKLSDRIKALEASEHNSHGGFFESPQLIASWALVIAGGAVLLIVVLQVGKPSKANS